MPGLSGDRIRARLADARLYLCTPMRPDLAEFADAALAGGIDIIQLREKPAMEAADELAALETLAEVCARRGALLAVNDRADIALASGADVLHLGQDDLPVPHARRVVGEDVAIGRSTHSLEQAAAAGVDAYITSDLRHHPALEHVEASADPAAVPALIDVPHAASEALWLPLARDLLTESVPGLEVLLSEHTSDPWGGRSG